MRSIISDNKLFINLESSDIAEIIRDKYFKPSPNGHWEINVKGSAEIVIPLADGKKTEAKKDDVPLISLEGYAETHEELERMVRNCERELEEARKKLELVCLRRKNNVE